MAFMGIAKVVSLCSDYSIFHLEQGGKVLEVTVATKDIEDIHTAVLKLKKGTVPLQVVEFIPPHEDRAIEIPHEVRQVIANFPRGFNIYNKRRA